MFIVSSVTDKLVKSAKSSRVIVEYLESTDEEFIKVLKLSHTCKTKRVIYATEEQKNIIAKTINAKLDKIYCDIITSEDRTIDNFIFLAQSYLNICHVYIYSINDTHLDIANSNLNKCMNLLRGKEIERKGILIVVDVCHFLGFLYLKWKKYEQSLTAFEKALQFYLAYSDNETKYVTPIYDVSCFMKPDESADPDFLLEERCTMILQDLLAGIICTQTNDKDRIDKQITDKVAVYKHKMLKRVLNKTLSSEEYVKWAIQFIHSAEILTEFEHFTIVRDFLAAASFMIKMYYQKYGGTDEEVNSTEKTSLLRTYTDIRSDIDYSWGYYGVKLLQSSQERLLPDIKSKYCVTCNSSSTVNEIEKFTEPLEFMDIIEDLKDLKEFTVKITDKYFTCYTDAKTVFATVLTCFQKALDYFSVPSSNYMKVKQEIAHAYKYLAKYEKDEIKQIKLYNLRKEILTDIVKGLNSENNANILKYIWIDIADVNSDILSTITNKLRCIYTHDVSDFDTDLFTKCGQLVQEILRNWQLYIDYAL